MILQVSPYHSDLSLTKYVECGILKRIILSLNKWHIQLEVLPHLSQIQELTWSHGYYFSLMLYNALTKQNKDIGDKIKSDRFIHWHLKAFYPENDPYCWTKNMKHDI